MADVTPRGWRQRGESLVALFVIACVGMLVIPLPAFVLDVLMAVNIAASLVIVLTVLYQRNALDFAAFPTLLLFAAVFGLALNVSSTRLILAEGAGFDGRIVRAFGAFVVGSPGAAGHVIGLLIFILIIAVQFVVITKGAARVAEVAARFTLEALPGRQMAIDAEYGAGLIDAGQAAAARDDLRRQSDFYGAMDGACKFVSGNVRVGILITAVNAAGGLIVGVTIHGEPWRAAVDTYVALTIGDGLVTQLPALLISTATGVIVTRSAARTSLGAEVARQFTQQDRPYWIAAAALAVLGLLPGFPWYVLMPVAAGLAALAAKLRRGRAAAGPDAEPPAAAAGAGAVYASPAHGASRGAAVHGAAVGRAVHAASDAAVAPRPAATGPRPASGRAARPSPPAHGPASGPMASGPLASPPPLDPLSLDIGYALIPLADAQRGAELLERIGAVRSRIADEIGLVVPKVGVRDDGALRPAEYRFRIRGAPAGGGTIRVGCYAAVPPARGSAALPGTPVTHPAYGRPVWWIADEDVAHAERLGYAVVEPQALIAGHLRRVIRRRAADLLDRETVRALLEGVRAAHPTAVREATAALSIGRIRQVLQALLAEQVSIRDLASILETLADHAAESTDPRQLTEHARRALGRQICEQHAADGRILQVITVHPDLERRIAEAAPGANAAAGASAAVEASAAPGNGCAPASATAPSFAAEWTAAVAARVATARRDGRSPVLLCSPGVRAAVRGGVAPSLPRLAVLSRLEVDPDVEVAELGQVDAPAEGSVL